MSSKKQMLRNLEKEFLKSTQKQALENKSSAQEELLRSQLEAFYSDMPEGEALKMLLQMVQDDYDQRAVAQSSRETGQFLEYCQRWQFVGFSLDKIVFTEDGKKQVVGMPSWKFIHRDNFTSYIRPDHQAFAFLTGKLSGITVIDCDTHQIYNEIIRHFPVLESSLTVLTLRGAHIYCQYTPGVRTSRETFHSFPAVDVRNDEGIIFAPPTTYQVDENTVACYTFVDKDAPIVHLPEALLQDVKQEFKWDENTSPRVISSVSDLTKKELQLILKLFTCHERRIFNRIPVVVNGIFEIGYQPPLIETKVLPYYYFSAFEILRIVINHGDWPRLLRKLEKFSADLTFDVYQDSVQNYVLYCLSRAFHPRDSLATNICIAFEADPVVIQFSLYNGWVTPVTNTSETWVGRFGSAAVVPDFELLLTMKNRLIQAYGEMDKEDLSLSHLKETLFSLPMPQLTSNFFISFPTDPSFGTETEDTRENASP